MEIFIKKSFCVLVINITISLDCFYSPPLATPKAHSTAKKTLCIHHDIVVVRLLFIAHGKAAPVRWCSSRCDEPALSEVIAPYLPKSHTA